MNVIVSNEHKNELSNLDIDIIKSISGVYNVSEIIEMFKNFFFDKMVLDVTALREYDNLNTYKKLVSELEPDKIIFLLPEGSSLCSANFLGYLISFGIYNFTSNINGVNYLIRKPNTYQDVENIAKMANINPNKDVERAVVNTPIRNSGGTGPIILGFRNVTNSAGATTLIYMMKKELGLTLGQDKVLAIEINKMDFPLFYEKGMISIKDNDLSSVLAQVRNYAVVLVDLNTYPEDSFCNDIVYLIEPSSIKLNRIVRGNKGIFNSLVQKRVILNQSLLLNNDVVDFENESGLHIFYNMPPLDERKRNGIISDFISKLGLLNGNNRGSSGGIFGLFRR